jgi:hypothetical protein
VAAAVCACSTQSAKNTSDAGASAASTAAAATAPSSSPLSKVTIGMNKKQVSDVAGHPTDENSYSTGKVWIPFYFGTDARRTSWYYKGEGVVVFADGNAFGGGTPEVIRVDYDPAETGVAR